MGKKPLRKGKGKSKQPILKSRKEIRKDQRKEKKLKRTIRHQPKITESQPENTSGSNTNKDSKPSTARNQQTNHSTEELRNNEKVKEKRLQKDMVKSRKRQLLAANEEEDRNIRHLEKLLHLNRRKAKSLPKSFADDGLGYLLEVCDPETIKDSAKVDQALHDSGSEFEEDFAVVRGKKKVKNNVDSKNSSKKVKKKEKVDEDDEMDADEDSGSDFGLGEDDVSDMPDDESMSSVESCDGTDKKKQVKGLKTKENVLKAKKKVKFSNTNEMDLSEDSGSDFGLGVDDGSDDELSDIGTDDEMLNEDSLEEENSSQSDDEDDGSQSSHDSSTKFGAKKVAKIISKGKQEKGKPERSTSSTKMSKGALKKSGKVKEEVSEGSEDEDIDTDGAIESNFEDDLESEAEGGKETTKRNADGTWEDIYGRTRDKDGNVVEGKAKYIPPALRAKMHADQDVKRKESLARLRRQIKGLINRLAENNMASICNQIDELFMKNSRNDMNESLLGIITDALVSGVLTPDRLVMEHTLLIAVLHANVGTEVGAHFLQNMMKLFQKLLEESTEVENKELDNVLLILSHLYNFKIFTASLMYEILDKIAETLNEKRIELLLLVLRSVGFSLRKDDPLALKSLILKLQGKAVSCSSSTSSRVKFMLEILMAIKNNNVSKIPSYSPEHVEHLKKLLRSLVRRGNYVAELKISLDDLLKADERGRWWIVGSAWTGHLPGENPSANQNSQTLESVKSGKTTESAYSAQLLALAKKQRMNTGVRKDIFCILMTAEDFLDAFEKLLHLNLKNQQRQEIVAVLFDCCLQEKLFNPYYAHLSQKFCDFDRQYQMKFQYCLWDKLKELDNLKNSQLSNMAKLLAHLFLEKGLAISALKVMSFAEMDKPCIRLVRQVLLIILLSEDLSKCEAVFQRVAPSPQLHLFREGLRLFINHFVLRKSSKGSLPKEEVELLENRVKIAVRALSSTDSRMEF